MIQLLSAFFGSLGFSLIFHVGRKHTLLAAVGGMLVWGVFLLCNMYFGMNVFLSTVISSAFGQVFSEFMARIFKTPTTVFYIPSVVPLIPGGSLYNTMYAAVFQNWSGVRHYGMMTLEGTLGISIGLCLISATLYVITKLARQKAMKK